mgnify:CR=1 FL=1
MNLNRTLIAVSISAALIHLTAAASQADMMTYNGVGLNQTVRIHHPDRTVRVKAGFMNLTYQDVTFDSFCVEVTANAGSSEVTERPLSGLANGDLVACLWETHFDEADTSLEAAALQVAIWELTHEATQDFDAAEGSFYITDNAAVAAQANVWLDALQDDYTPKNVFKVLHSSGRQDMLLATGVSVPEPAALTTTLLGAVGFLLRRRYA